MTPVHLVYCLSGFVSLGYQVVWFRVFVDHFGSTNLTFALVLANFIGGLGGGALASRWLSARLGGLPGLAHPLRRYGAIELAVGLTALLTLLVLALPPDLLGSFPYRQAESGIWHQSPAYLLMKVGISAILVLVPCFFMGAGFPLLCHAFRGRASFPSALYAWNTLGACGGVLFCELLLLPGLGHDRTFLIMVALNLGIAALALLAPRALEGRDRAREARERAPAPGGEGDPATGSPRFLLLCAIASGLLAGGLEGDMFKRLWFLECNTGAAMSFISFWAILAIFLASVTVRAAPRLRLIHIQAAYLAAMGVYALVWTWAYELRGALEAVHGERARDSLAELEGLGGGVIVFHFAHSLRDVFLFTGLFVFPTYYLISLLLPWVCNRIQGGRRHLGRAYGWNTVAFCAGLVGFTWIAPRVSVFFSMKLAFWLLGGVAGLLLLLRESRQPALWKPALAMGVLGAGWILTPRGFDPGAFHPADPPARYPVRAMKSNGAHTTFVLEGPRGDVLYFDSHPMSGLSGASQRYMRLMAHFPLLLQEDPRRALLICFGVGNTASAIAAHAGIRDIDVVDLNHKVYETAPEFSATNHDVARDPRLDLIHDDGRNFLELCQGTYDLITSEPPPPMQEGVYRLYSREYYGEVLEHLSPEGMMTQWVPIYQMPREAVDLALATFVQSFPHSLLFVGSSTNFILLGGRQPFELGRIETRFGESVAVVEDLREIGVFEPLQLLARIVQGGESLAERWRGAPHISDQRNDFAWLVRDVIDPPRIPFDPVEVLNEIGGEPLPGAARLESWLTDLSRLRAAVPDFPDSSLMSVPDELAGRVAGADADWARIDAANRQARRARRQGRLPAAAELLEDSLRRAPGQNPIRGRLARILEELGRTEEARAAWARCLEIDPLDSRSLLGLAELEQRLGRYGEAAAHLARAVERVPFDPQVRLALAEALVLAGRTTEAVGVLERALELAPGDERIRARLSAARGDGGGPR